MVINLLLDNFSDSKNVKIVFFDQVILNICQFHIFKITVRVNPSIRGNFAALQHIAVLQHMIPELSIAREILITSSIHVLARVFGVPFYFAR
jgi:hypothetical protein